MRIRISQISQVCEGVASSVYLHTVVAILEVFDVTGLISGQENFLGTIVHPQNWTSEHDQILEGKRVALIGSGATAITIFPGIKVQICSV